MNFLESIIVSLVESEIEEATARVGPRTGAFEFHPNDLRGLARLLMSARNEIVNQIHSGRWNSDLALDATVSILSPIDNSEKVFPVAFVWNDVDSPGQVRIAKNLEIVDMVINLSKVENIRDGLNIIVHELTHVFDKQVKGYTSKIPVDKMSPEERDEHYWKSPMEMKAFLHQLIDGAKHIIGDLLNLLPSEVAKDYLKKLEKNPLLLKKLMEDGWSSEPGTELFSMGFFMKKLEKNPAFEKALHKALFDIVQAYVVPKLREIENE